MITYLLVLACIVGTVITIASILAFLGWVATALDS